jgi:hypothetical protein
MVSYILRWTPTDGEERARQFVLDPCFGLVLGQIKFSWVKPYRLNSPYDFVLLEFL